MRTDRRTLLRAGLTAMLGAVAAGCSADRDTVTAPPFGLPAPIVPGAAPPAGGPISSVAMVGDSISVGARDPLLRMFAAADLEVTTLDAESGRRIVVGDGPATSGTDVARLIAADGSLPDLWVIALGTNDVQQYTADEYSAVISELLAVIPEDAPVVWVDVHIAQDVDRSSQFNTALNTALGARGSAVVAPWSASAPGDGVLSDGIHPSATGARLFADVVGAAVAVAQGR